MRLLASSIHSSSALARLSHVSVRAQGVAVLVFPIGALFAALLAIHWAEGSVREADSAVSRAYDTRADIAQIRSDLSNAEALSSGYAATGQSRFRESLVVVRSALNRSVAQLSSVVGEEPDAIRQVEEIRKVFADQNRVLEEIIRQGTAVRVTLFPTSRSFTAKLQSQLSALNDYEQLRFTQANSVRDAARSRLFIAVMLCGVIGPLGALFVHLVLAGRLARRIQSVEVNARRLAHGLPLEPVPQGNDEIASLAKQLEDAAVLLNARERGLREGERRYRDLFDQAPIPYEETDREGVVHRFNQAVCQLLKATPDQIMGCLAWDFVAPDQQERFRLALMERLRLGTETGPYESDYMLHDGSRITVEIRENLIRDDMGEITGLCRSLLDVTERNLAAVAARKVEQYAMELRNKNEQLARALDAARSATAAKSRFLASVSHELRTPLNSIIGFSEIMYDGRLGPLEQDHRECLADILTSGRHLLQLINDVLDLSKVEAGKMEFHPEPVSVEALVGEVRDVVRPLAEKKRLQLTATVPSGLMATLDPARFKQVLYNYLSNAVKFTPVEGAVRVRVTLEGDSFFRLEVEDNGVGIEPGEIAQLFQEFQQLPHSRKDGQGTGLGLALTRRIVEAQGGRVGVRSDPGKGSTFTAVLPLRNAIESVGAAG